MRSVPITVLACAAVLSGDAGVNAGSPTERTCIRRREINAISALDDRHALARLGAGRLSLFTLDQTCRDLRSARKLVLERSAAQICGDGTSLLSFEQPGVGLTRCRIEKIESVANKVAALELIAAEVPPK